MYFVGLRQLCPDSFLYLTREREIRVEGSMCYFSPGVILLGILGMFCLSFIRGVHLLLCLVAPEGH
jgi:hypothetical protein